jgi:hypothetical protein
VTLQLQPKGDAILGVHDSNSDIRREFIVSLVVLSVASNYFETLLRSDFQEGLETPRGNCPSIYLEDDDLKAVGSIFSVLRYQNFEIYDILLPKELAAVALHSDKYDCNLRPKSWRRCGRR